LQSVVRHRHQPDQRPGPRAAADRDEDGAVQRPACGQGVRRTRENHVRRSRLSGLPATGLPAAAGRVWPGGAIFNNVSIQGISMSSIRRVNVEKRLSDMAVYNGVAYLAGQVPDDATLDMAGQTRQVLATIDRLLAEAGTDKTKILMAQIFVANMKEFDAMNQAWDEWVAAGNSPPRATVEARLANPDYKVEIVVTAAVN